MFHLPSAEIDPEVTQLATKLAETRVAHQQLLVKQAAPDLGGLWDAVKGYAGQAGNASSQAEHCICGCRNRFSARSKAALVAIRRRLSAQRRSGRPAWRRPRP